MRTHNMRRRSLSPLALLSLLSLFLTTATAAVLGIDLGTEYIKAALVKPGIPLDIVLTKDSKRKEAAAVAFKPIKQTSSSEKGVFPERLYGGDAVALSARFPDNTFVNIKSLLGVLATDDAVRRYKERYPAALVEAEQVRDTVALRSPTFEGAELAFAVEELLAMQLQNIAANAEAVAGSKIKDVVITIPAYWTVEEKDAVRSAAELAGLQILSLTTDGLAVGINYATTRVFPVVNDGNGSKPEYHIVYDMGAGGTTATVLRMQGRNVKDIGRFNKTVQEVQVVGVGWDKTLGGDALNTLILSDMIDKLVENSKIKALGASREAIAKDGRTVSKLWKESERLRQVLSANTETQASFEGIYNEDVSFKYKLKRTDFEKMVEAYVDRVKNPIDQAMHSARLEFSDIESIIAHGGAQRTPFVQRALEKVIGNAEKVRNNVNADEAAAFGAAFLGASLSPSFRVKEIRASEVGVHDVWISWDQDGKQKKQKIFTEMSKAGANKQIPFKKTEDFKFDIYQQVLDGDNMRNVPVWKIDTTNLTAAVKELTEKHGCAVAEVSTQFEIGLNAVENLPEVFRGTVSCEIVDDGKKGGIVDGIKGLFGGKKDDQKVVKGDDSTDASADSTAASSSTASSGASEPTKGSESGKAGESKKKTVTVYVGFQQDVTQRKLQVTHMEHRRTLERINDFKKSDENRAKRSEALNQLEAYTYRVRDMLENEEFIKASTEKQRNEISQRSSDASEWLYGDGSEAATKDFKKRLDEIKKLVEPIEARRKEASGRPEFVEKLEQTIESTRSLLETMKEGAVSALKEYEDAIAASSSSATAEPQSSSTKDELDELDDETSTTALSTPTPIPSPALKVEDFDAGFASLEKAEAWLKEKVAAQKKLSASDDPTLLIADIETEDEKLTKITRDLLQKQFRAQAAQMEKEKSKSKKASSSKSKSKSKTSKTKSSKSSSGSSSSSKSSTKSSEAAKSSGKDEL